MRPNQQPGSHTRSIFIPGQATAGTADEWVALPALENIKITAARWTPVAAVTGDNTNYFGLQVKNGSTGVTSVKNYTSGIDSVAKTTETLTLSTTAADVEIDAGEVVSLVRTVAASGLAMPDGILELDFQYR